ncbi:hypothetical protein Bca4012_010210 [Brassica carinata]
MDYYKEEADTAREAAMNKFLANDFAGARKFALKAQSLNPDIDGITHMNRTEKSFSDDQLWASYDSLEGMPRVYFMIDKVLSVDPFKVCITKLTISDTNSELRSLHWLGLGVPRTCGGFRADKSKIWHSPYIFSHKVEVVKGNHHGEFLIYPRTGDVWALYKNWSYEWNYLAEGKPVKYDVVEVLEGYTEEYGVTVVPLVKVDSFNSVCSPVGMHLMNSEVAGNSTQELHHHSCFK